MQERLGHLSIATTADPYVHVPPTSTRRQPTARRTTSSARPLPSHAKGQPNERHRSLLELWLWSSASQSKSMPTSSTAWRGRAQPVAGVTELVWNALDAEADSVSVVIVRNELDGVDFVVVEDDGHGMTHAEVVRDFRRLGGSWKKMRSTSKNGKRPLHGKEGAG